MPDVTKTTSNCHEDTSDAAREYELYAKTCYSTQNGYQCHESRRPSHVVRVASYVNHFLPLGVLDLLCCALGRSLDNIGKRRAR